MSEEIVDKWRLVGDTTDAQRAAREFVAVQDKVSVGAAESTKQLMSTRMALTRLGTGLQQSSGLLAALGLNVGGVAGKFALLAGSISTGGVFGIALAGLSGAIGVGTLAWKMYRTEADAVAKSFEATGKALDRTREYVSKLSQEVRASQRELANFGLSESARLGQSAESIQLEVNKSEEALARRKVQFFAESEKGFFASPGQFTDEQKTEIQQEEKRIALLKEEVVWLKAKSDVTVALGAKKEEQKEAEKERKTGGGGGGGIEFGDIDASQFVMTGAGMVTKEQQQIMLENRIKLGELTFEIEKGLEDTANENLIRRAELEMKTLDDTVGAYAETYDRIGSVVTGVYSDIGSAMTMMIENQKMEWGSLALIILKSIGKQVMADGIKAIAGGTVKVATSIYPYNPIKMAAGTGEIAAGAAETAVGAALMAGSVAIGKGGGGGTGGGGGGSGGSPDAGGGGFGPRDTGGNKANNQPVQIIIAGALTTEETAVLVSQGMQLARDKGLL